MNGKLVLVCIAVLVGCVQSPVSDTRVRNGQAPPPVAKPAPPDAKGLSDGLAANDTPPELEKLAPEDALVLAAVLDGFSLEKSLPGLKDRRLILVNFKTLAEFRVFESGQMDIELRNEHWSLPKGILDSLKRRNAKPVSLKGASLGANVVLEDFDALSKDDPDHPHFEFTLWTNLEKKHPDAKHDVWFWVPGYSSDGKTAIVRLSFGPTAHGASATYLLVKEDGKWTVQRRHISYYA